MATLNAKTPAQKIADFIDGKEASELTKGLNEIIGIATDPAVMRLNQPGPDYFTGLDTLLRISRHLEGLPEY